MKLFISENIRRLRIKHGITQEVLADFIGVSAQAVSKWERGDGFPDITLLPTIANYFGVSLDELCGMDELRDSEKLNDYVKRHNELRSAGKTDDDLALLREALTLYPNNYSLMKELAEYTPDTDESMRLCDRIIAYCSDESLRCYATYQRCFLLEISGRHDEALSEADKLPPLEYSSELNIGMLLSGHARVVQAEEALTVLIWALYSKIEQLDSPDEFTFTERINMYDKMLSILEILFDNNLEDMKGEHIYAYKCYFYSALICLENGMFNDAADRLEKAAMHAKKWDSLSGSTNYTSLLFSKLTFDSTVLGRDNITVLDNMCE